MKTKTWLCLGAASVFLLVGCGGNKEPAITEDAVLPMITVDPATAGTITGKVVFMGEKPVMPILSMDATPACARQHSSPVRSEEVVVNDNGTLKNVFVWVKAGLPPGRWPAPDAAAKLDQRGCVYAPHVLGVMTNQRIEIRNSDPTSHNVHSLAQANREWNESQAPGSDVKIKWFPREEIAIPLKCNVHPWMRCYIGVVSHPFFAVTGADGTFAISGLPPGEYTLGAWQERYGTRETRVTVRPKETETADFSFPG